MKLKNNVNNKLPLIPVLLFLLQSSVSCKKLVEVDTPVTAVTGESVFASDVTATAVITGLYTQMSVVNYRSGTVSIPSLSVYSSLSADELTLWNGNISTQRTAYYTNNLSSNGGGFELWNNTYPQIFIANSAIKGLENSMTLTPTVKQQLLGEAKFMRAFYYFYLVNLYGDVPLVLGTDYTTNARLPRTAKAEVYQQIIADLKDAQVLLNPEYVQADAYSSTTERVRPNKWAAVALLARTYLFVGEYSNAEAQATMVINNKLSYDLTGLDSVFLSNSQEAIWQLQPVTSGDVTNTQDAKFFVIPTTGPNMSLNPVYLSANQLNSFKPGDNRRKKWVDSVISNGTSYYYPSKYKAYETNAPVTEYLMVLRLGEQYLIRAEARAMQNNLVNAKSDLNTIRARSGLPVISHNTQADVLAAILNERQTELFTELGHRWMDLKRTHLIDNVMTSAALEKGGTWNANKQLYPLPTIDIQRNQNLIQNNGY